ncbi:MAG TPA: globin [Cytophagaceae bacterium]|jgi:hemoglobin|nr:globin [Cytophagaceae bacterium]
MVDKIEGMEHSLYDRLGKANLELLVGYFYDLVFEDPQIKHLFQNDKSEIMDKQFMFLSQFLGGPSIYSDKYGHPRLRARHIPHRITQSDAVAWLKCMSVAIGKLPISEELKDELFERFPQTAMFMVNTEE